MPPLEPPPTDHAPARHRRPRVRPVLRAIRGLRNGPAREDARRTGSLWAIATALTLLFFAVLGSAIVTVRDVARPERKVAADSTPAAAPERVVFVPIPRPTTTPSALPPPASAIEQPSPVLDRRQSPGRVTTPRDSGASAGVPIAPAPRQPDSTAAASAPSTRPNVDAPRAVFPVQPCDLACEIRRGEGGVGRGGGGSLTTAQRDSALREAARRAREAQRRAPDGPVGPTAPSTTPVPVQQGASVQVGLPGGGPTAAQRKRARELDAEVSARLARIKARADSIQQARDSAGKKP